MIPYTYPIYKIYSLIEDTKENSNCISMNCMPTSDELTQMFCFLLIIDGIFVVVACFSEIHQKYPLTHSNPNK